ncbi:MAG: class I SAM-dependent methyltransferase [Pseudorhodobacter sp.]|nr:class I SAM-dependent methyltransferase [Pseudorhodobacter sp.]
MLQDRQAIADAVLKIKPTWARRAQTWLRHKARIVAFALPSVRRLIERDRLTPTENKAHWDGLLSDTQFSTYLGGTIDVDGGNALTAVLLKYHAVQRPSVLDVGCAGGTLVNALHAFSRYFGTDVSGVAIDSARAMVAQVLPDRQPDITLEAADLRDFDPPETFDAVLFNEVLYYLKTDQAMAQVQRFAAKLNPGGLVMVSMKDDGKSRAIFHLLRPHFDWVDGILWQRKATSPDFRIRPNRERTAYLIGVMRPKAGR